MGIYSFTQKEHLDKIFDRLGKKNPKQMGIIYKKLEHILENPYRFKPLRNDKFGERAVHIDKHFVLLYSIDENRKIVILEDYDHHEAIFGK